MLMSLQGCYGFSVGKMELSLATEDLLARASYHTRALKLLLAYQSYGSTFKFEDLFEEPPRSPSLIAHNLFNIPFPCSFQPDT